MSAHLWECSVCCVPRPWSWPRTPCPNCGAHQLTIVGGRSIDAAVANGAMCEVERIVRAYVDDAAETVEIFRCAGAHEANEPRDTERPPPMFSEEEAGTFDPVCIVNDTDEIERRDLFGGEGVATSFELYGDRS